MTKEETHVVLPVDIVWDLSRGLLQGVCADICVEGEILIQKVFFSVSGMSCSILGHMEAITATSAQPIQDQCQISLIATTVLLAMQ